MTSDVVERSTGHGWARRALWGGAGAGGAVARGLALPISWAWRTASEARMGIAAGSAERLTAPTVSVGNVTVGGGGKTSLVLWLLATGLPPGARAAVLTRGHGRAGTGVRAVSPGLDAAAAEVGDEPALLARAGAWVGVGADRRAAARAVAAAARPDLFLLDDGLQHRRVARALDLVTFTADDLAAPARCLPAGPLRQGPGWRPPAVAWVVTGSDPRLVDWAPGSIGAAFAGWWRELPGTEADWVDGGTVELAAWVRGEERPHDPDGAPAVAFAGVAHPESVARFAKEAGHRIVRTVAFPDHHRYRPADAARLRAEAPGASFLTTEKDAVKLVPEWFGDRPVGVLRRRLAPREPDLLTGLVREAMAWPR